MSGDSLYPIVAQLRKAVAWIYANAHRFGGDPQKIHISGHSSGGHLAAVLLTTDWNDVAGLPADVLKSGICCSGMYDMEPVRLSSRGDYIGFTDAMEADMSPQRHIAKLNAPLGLVYGSYETPEFKRHAIEFAQLVGRGGQARRIDFEAQTITISRFLKRSQTLTDYWGVSR